MYIDLLTKIKNAQAVRKENIKVPYSKMDESVLGILAQNNYLESYEKKGRGANRVLDIKLRYDKDKGVISGAKFISKASRRIYIGYKDIWPVKNGFGLAVLSTPQGIMSGKEAKKRKVGGELLFEVW